jgi:hypothetical protein
MQNRSSSTASFTEMVGWDPAVRLLHRMNTARSIGLITSGDANRGFELVANSNEAWNSEMGWF